MATPRVLASPPITEALVDLRTSVDQPAAAFDALAQLLHAEYPHAKTRQGLQAELRIVDGKLIPPVPQDLGFQGLQLSNSAETVIVQVRPDGFTLNNLKTYMGGEQLLGEALRVWALFVSRMQPRIVTRVALRYINQLSLPWKDGDEFEKYLAAAPRLPLGAPQTISGFLSRVVAQDNPAEATVIVMQDLNTHGEVPLLTIDVDAFRVGEFSTEPMQLHEMLKVLRELKNRTFFSLLTDEAVRLYA